MNDHIIPLLVDSQQLNKIIIIFFYYNDSKDLLLISTIKIMLYSSRYTNNDNRWTYKIINCTSLGLSV